MSKFILREYIRESKIQIKNYIIEIVGIIIICLGLLRFAARWREQNDILLKNNITIIWYMVCFICLLFIFFRTSPIFVIKPASFQFFFNSPFIKYALILAVLKTAIIRLIVSVLIGLFLLEWDILLDFCISIFYLLIYLMLIVFIEWMKFNEKNIGIILLQYVCSSIFFILSQCKSHGIGIILVIWFGVVVLITIKSSIKWDKYYNAIFYIEKVNSAGRYRNIAAMQQIVSEKTALQEHYIYIYDLPLNQKNALLCKAFIENIRTGKNTIIVLGVLLLGAIVITKTTFLADMPLIGNPYVARIIGMFIFATFVANIKEMYAKQILSIFEKHKKGFFIPYSFSRVIFSYALICFGFISIVIIPYCLIMMVKIREILILITVIWISIALFFTFMRWPRLFKYCNFLTNILIFVFSGLIF